MNIKSLLIGSAAALVAVSGARAADAIVVAEPEPAEYVRICDVYGAGYYYIPGTETCLRVGGYVRVQLGFGDRAGHQDVLDKKTFVIDEEEDFNDTFSWLTRADVQLDARTETELGTLRSYIEFHFDHASDTVFSVDDEGEPEFGPFTTSGSSWALDHAYIQLGGLTIGYSDSLFESLTGSAGALVIDDSIVAYSPGKSNYVAYTFDAGNGFAATLGLETGTGLDYIDSYVPHVVVGASYTQGWGAISGVVGYDSVWGELAGKVRADVTINDQLSVWVMGGLASGNDDADELLNHYNTWKGDWAIWGGFDYKFNEKGTLYAQLSYTNGNDLGIVGVDIDDGFAISEYSKDIFGAAVGVNYELVPGFIIRPEFSYASAKSVDDDDREDEWGVNVRFQRSF